MERKGLPLMFALFAGSWAQDLMVFQSHFAQGTEGGSITLPCSYKANSKPMVGSYRWLKDQELEVINTTREFKGRVTYLSGQDFLLGKRADIVIQDLRLYDTGMYHCVVNINGLQETSGNGTKLQVMKTEDKSYNHTVLMWLLLRSILCTFGIVTVALGTHLYYEKTISEEVNAPQKE